MRRKYAAARLAEADARGAGPLAPALEDQRVAIFEKGALFLSLIHI